MIIYSAPKVQKVYTSYYADCVETAIKICMYHFPLVLPLTSDRLRYKKKKKRLQNYANKIIRLYLKGRKGNIFFNIGNHY